MGFPVVYVAFKIKTLIFKPMRKLVLEIWLWALILKNRSEPWKNDYLENVNWIEKHTQPAFTCSKLTEETLEQGVKYVQIKDTRTTSVFVVNFEHISHLVLLFYC